jgi:hypothetical protein
MSHYDYKVGQQLDLQDVPFYALIQAAMRRADTDNSIALRLAFPDVWDELWARYNAPGGLLPGEVSA